MSKTTTTYGPKGKIVTVGTTGLNRLRTDSRINWITIYNTGSVTVNIIFEESTINAMPLPAATEIDFDVFRMLSLNVQTVDFTASSATTVNCIWAEGPSLLYVLGKG